MILNKMKVQEKLKSYRRVKSLDAKMYRSKSSLDEEKANYHMVK